MCISASVSKAANWNLAVCLPMPSPSGRVAERKRGRERLLSFRRNIRNDLRFTALFRPSVRTGAPSPKGKAFPRQIPIFQLTNPWGYAPSNSKSDKNREPEWPFRLLIFDSKGIQVYITFLFWKNVQKIGFQKKIIGNGDKNIDIDLTNMHKPFIIMSMGGKLPVGYEKFLKRTDQKHV